MNHVWLQRGMMIFCGVVALLGSSELWDRGRPREYWFGTEDLEARTTYEQILAAHGYPYRYEKDVHGETNVVVDSITKTEYKKVDCAFYAWDAKRQRAKGVIVYDRDDCAL